MEAKRLEEIIAYFKGERPSPDDKDEWTRAFLNPPKNYEVRDALESLDRENKQLKSLQFPTMLRKMWSGGEVQKWFDEQVAALARE